MNYPDWHPLIREEKHTWTTGPRRNGEARREARRPALQGGAWWDELVNFDLHTPERLNCGAVLGGISMGRRGRGWRRRRGREELGRDSGAHEEQNTRTELTAWATASAISSSKMPGQDRLHRTLPAARISSDGMH
jgi:hypothetical protein